MGLTYGCIVVSLVRWVHTPLHLSRLTKRQMMKGADTMSKLTRAEWHRIVNRAYEKAGKCPPDCPGRCPDTWLTGDGVGCLDDRGKCIMVSDGNED